MDTSITKTAAPTSEMHESEPLPPNYFSPQTECTAAWRNIYSEWKRGGGGIKHSLTATRKQIAQDGRSRFAEIVRRAWASQQKARHISDIGKWPVPVEELRRVTASVEFMSADGLPEECQTVSWLDHLVWNDISRVEQKDLKVRSLLESPDGMEWASPYAQQWIKYWLFVKIGAN